MPAPLCTALRTSSSRRLSAVEPVTYSVDGEKRRYRGGDDFGWGQEFQRIGDILEEPDIRRGKVLEADCTLIDARALLAAALMKMRAEPYSFVTDISPWI